MTYVFVFVYCGWMDVFDVDDRRTEKSGEPRRCSEAVDNAVGAAKHPAQSINSEQFVPKRFEHAPCRSSRLKQLNVVDDADDATVSLNSKNLVQPLADQ